MSGCQYGFLTSGMFQVAGTHKVQDLVTGQVPEILVENLHLDGAGVASGLNGSAQATQFDGPIAHHTAREQQIGGRNQPVADVKAQDVAGGRGDLRVDLGVPPDVIDIEDHTHPSGVQTTKYAVRI